VRGEQRAALLVHVVAGHPERKFKVFTEPVRVHARAALQERRPHHVEERGQRQVS
jgi:hypothetical protein